MMIMMMMPDNRAMRTSSGSPRMLEAEPKEMWRSRGGLSGLQSPPPAVRLAAVKSTSGYVCTLSPACMQTSALAPAIPRTSCCDLAAASVLVYKHEAFMVHVEARSGVSL